MRESQGKKTKKKHSLNVEKCGNKDQESVIFFCVVISVKLNTYLEICSTLRDPDSECDFRLAFVNFETEDLLIEI